MQSATIIVLLAATTTLVRAQTYGPGDYLGEAMSMINTCYAEHGQTAECNEYTTKMHQCSDIAYHMFTIRSVWSSLGNQDPFAARQTLVAEFGEASAELAIRAAPRNFSAETVGRNLFHRCADHVRQEIQGEEQELR